MSSQEATTACKSHRRLNQLYRPLLHTNRFKLTLIILCEQINYIKSVNDVKVIYLMGTNLNTLYSRMNERVVGLPIELRLETSLRY